MSPNSSTITLYHKETVRLEAKEKKSTPRTWNDPLENLGPTDTHQFGEVQNQPFASNLRQRRTQRATPPSGSVSVNEEWFGKLRDERGDFTRRPHHEQGRERISVESEPTGAVGQD